MSATARTFRERFDARYKTRGDWRCDPCVYCGLPATCFDHVPPLRIVETMDDAELDAHNPVKHPACHECNSTLGAMLLLTLKERRKHLSSVYRRKYKKFIRMPEWDEEDLAELAEDFANEMRRAARFARMTKARIARLRGA